MVSLPAEIQARVGAYLDVFAQNTASATCRRATDLRMREDEYVRQVKQRFVATVPSFSGQHLMWYRAWGLVLDAPSSSDAYWFKGTEPWQRWG